MFKVSLQGLQIERQWIRETGATWGQREAMIGLAVTGRSDSHKGVCVTTKGIARDTENTESKG